MGVWLQAYPPQAYPTAGVPCHNAKSVPLSSSALPVVCSVSSATTRAAGPRLGWGASGLAVLSPHTLAGPQGRSGARTEGRLCSGRKAARVSGKLHKIPFLTSKAATSASQGPALAGSGAPRPRYPLAMGPGGFPRGAASGTVGSIVLTFARPRASHWPLRGVCGGRDLDAGAGSSGEEDVPHCQVPTPGNPTGDVCRKLLQQLQARGLEG